MPYTQPRVRAARSHAGRRCIALLYIAQPHRPEALPDAVHAQDCTKDRLCARELAPALAQVRHAPTPRPHPSHVRDPSKHMDAHTRTTCRTTPTSCYIFLTPGAAAVQLCSCPSGWVGCLQPHPHKTLCTIAQLHNGASSMHCAQSHSCTTPEYAYPAAFSYVYDGCATVQLCRQVVARASEGMLYFPKCRRSARWSCAAMQLCRLA